MKFSDWRRSAGRLITTPLNTLLIKSRLTPNALTWGALVVSLIAAVAIALNHPIWGGCLVLLSGLFDILDGALARLTNQSTKFGAVLDSTFDRISDAAILLGILLSYREELNTAIILVIILALIASFLISYVRARAEGAGIDCSVGLFTRTERVIILALGLLLSPLNKYILPIALLVLVVLGFVTVVQRLVYVWRQTK